jgi:hypothetical protein
MYQQQSSGKALVWLLLIIAAICIALGLAVADVPQQLAGAREKDVATEYQQKLNELAIQKQAAQTEAEIRQIELQEEFLKRQQEQALELQAQLNARAQAHQEAINAQELALIEREAQVNEVLRIGLAIAAGLATLILAGAAAIRLARRRKSDAAPAADSRQSSEVWRAICRIARANEILKRQIDLLSQTATSASPAPKGRRKWSDLPLAVPRDDGQDYHAPGADGSRQDQR